MTEVDREDAAATSPEWWLLEQLACGREPPADEWMSVADARRLDLGRLVGYAMDHALLAVVAHYFLTPEPRPRISRRSVSWLRHVQNAVRARALDWTNQAILIGETLRQSGVAYAHTKGVALQFQIYPTPGIRAYGDIDFMVRPDQIDLVDRTLRQLGLDYGTYDERAGILVAQSREARLLYRLNRDHLPHFSKALPSAAVPYVSVDVATSFTWTGAPWEVDADDIFDAIGDLEQFTPLHTPDTESFPVLRADFSFLFCLLHVFREAWFPLDIRSTDVTLSQFGELVRFQRSDPSLCSRTAQLVARYDLAQPVAWVARSTDALFATNLARDLGLEATGDADAVMRELGGVAHPTAPEEMRERLMKVLERDD